jgi:hypothetical protein
METNTTATAATRALLFFDLTGPPQFHHAIDGCFRNCKSCSRGIECGTGSSLDCQARSIAGPRHRVPSNPDERRRQVRQGLPPPGSFSLSTRIVVRPARPHRNETPGQLWGTRLVSARLSVVSTRPDLERLRWIIQNSKFKIQNSSATVTWRLTLTSSVDTPAQLLRSSRIRYRVGIRIRVIAVANTMP